MSLNNEITHKFAVSIIESAIELIKSDENVGMWKDAAVRLLSEGLEIYKEYLKRRGYNIE